MKNTKIFAVILSLILTLSVLASCSASDKNAEDGGFDGWFDNAMDAEKEAAEDGGEDVGSTLDGQQILVENPFVDAAESPISTFSADVDTASYTYFRKLASQGYSLDGLKNQIKQAPLRTEEMINYFDYTYTMPAEGEVFGVQTAMAVTPWNSNSYLLILGLATETVEEKGANNLVFLIDVSGSMASSDKLPLLKKAFSNLVSALDEKDVVSIVTYSGKEAVVLSGCRGDRDEEIMNAINSLEAKGSTNGEAGMTKAYSLAKDYFIEGGNNRIIMASDGDLNVGISSEADLKAYIETKRNEGIFLSVLGFGTGNYKDAKMSALAENGNGVYYYIDGEREAEKVLGEDLLATLYTVAKDVKLQLTFDSATVSKYRLIGYESRMLNAEDFEDDTKDAGDVGAGHTVTVCYELILNDTTAIEGEPRSIATLGIRCKAPDALESVPYEYLITEAAMTNEPSDDFKYIACVIETAMILNGSKYNAGGVTLADVAEKLSALDLSADEYKAEFRSIIDGLVNSK